MKTFNLIKLSLIICVIGTSCDNRSRAEHLRDYLQDELLPKGFQGIIKKTELWKGCSYAIDIKTKTGKIEEISINNNCEILFQIKKGDYFNKIANSNKCSIARNDSIIYIDCIDLNKKPKNDKSLLSDIKIEERNREIINKWKFKKDKN